MAKIKVLRYALLQTVVLAYVGLLLGIIYSFGGMVYDLLTTGLNKGTALAFLALIGMPAIFAGVGFVTGIIGAFLYNLFSRWFGEVKIDIKQKR